MTQSGHNYLYLLDKLDALGFDDIANDLSLFPSPASWWIPQTSCKELTPDNTTSPQYIDKFYLTIYHVMLQYCQVQHNNNNSRIIDFLNNYYTFHQAIADDLTQFTSDPNNVKLNDSHRCHIFHLFANWLHVMDCYYLDLFLDTTLPTPNTSTCPLVNSTKSCNTSCGIIEHILLTSDDGAGLCIDFLLSEYQTAIYQHASSLRLSNESDLCQNTDIDPLNGDVSVMLNDVNNDQRHSTGVKRFDDLVAYSQQNLNTGQCSIQPSLMQLFSRSIATLSTHLLDIDTVLPHLENSNEDKATIKSDFTTSKSEVISSTQHTLVDSQLNAVLMFLPGYSASLDLKAVQNVTDKIALVFNHLYTLLTHISIPLSTLRNTNQDVVQTSTIATAIKKSLGLSNSFEEYNGQHPVLIPPTCFIALNEVQRAVLFSVFLQLKQDYGTRHKMLLQRFITQTQTFILTFKYHQLFVAQQNAQQNYNQPTKISTKSINTTNNTWLDDLHGYLANIYHFISNYLFTFPVVSLVDVLYTAPHVTMKPCRMFTTKLVPTTNQMDRNKPRHRVLHPMTDRNGRIY